MEQTTPTPRFVSLADRIAEHERDLRAQSHNYTWRFINCVVDYMRIQLADVQALEPSVELSQLRSGTKPRRDLVFELGPAGFAYSLSIEDFAGLMSSRTGGPSRPWPTWTLDILNPPTAGTPKIDTSATGATTHIRQTIHGSRELILATLSALTKCGVSVGPKGLLFESSAPCAPVLLTAPEPDSPDWEIIMRIAQAGHAACAHAQAELARINARTTPPVDKRSRVYTFQAFERDLPPDSAQKRVWKQHAGLIVHLILSMASGAEADVYDHMFAGRAGTTPGWEMLEVVFNARGGGSGETRTVGGMTIKHYFRAEVAELSAYDGEFTLTYKAMALDSK